MISIFAGCLANHDRAHSQEPIEFSFPCPPNSKSFCCFQTITAFLCHGLQTTHKLRETVLNSCLLPFTRDFTTVRLYQESRVEFQYTCPGLLILPHQNLNATRACMHGDLLAAFTPDVLARVPQHILTRLRHLSATVSTVRPRRWRRRTIVGSASPCILSGTGSLSPAGPCSLPTVTS